jgi:hypothetical protein
VLQIKPSYTLTYKPTFSWLKDSEQTSKQSDKVTASVDCNTNSRTYLALFYLTAAPASPTELELILLQLQKPPSTTFHGKGA